MSKPAYLMNTETREIYAYSEALEKMANPKFVPFIGKLPPPDFKRGVPIAKEMFSVRLEEGGPLELSEPERIEIIAGVVGVVPKEEISETGQPSLVVIEKMTGLKGVTRKEVNAATKLRLEALKERSLVAKAADKAEAQSAAE